VYCVLYKNICEQVKEEKTENEAFVLYQPFDIVACKFD
jgi:hypothetical protein